jgi:hypothetical protein
MARIQGWARLREAARLSSLIKLTYGRRLGRLHQYPACGGKGPEDETRLSDGISSQQTFRFAPWIRQG